jgi:hypothetical protein
VRKLTEKIAISSSRDCEPQKTQKNAYLEETRRTRDVCDAIELSVSLVLFLKAPWGKLLGEERGSYLGTDTTENYYEE